MPLPSKQSSSASDCDTYANSKPLTATKPIANPATIGPLCGGSNITIFLRNLRLLRLDESPDWPAITAQSLASKGPQQNQKNRIHCIEWALYRLFEIWDPEDTRNKLRPFFPPLQPLQSLNLRAALYRTLSELKKNGFLGREIILRKTMLDDCTGDRFEEVLAIFSTLVLKKVILAEKDRQINIARKLATAGDCSPEEQRSLLPLVCAHRASLMRQLRTKQILRSRYEVFAKSLELKSRDIEKMTEQLTAGDRGASKKDDVEANEAEMLTRQVRENWLGEARWAELILGGELQRELDPVLGSTFADVWPQVKCGGFETIGDQRPTGLLDDLASRVSGQRQRLQRWKRYREDLRAIDQASGRSDASTKPDPLPASKINVRFREHQNLIPSSMSTAAKTMNKSIWRPMGDLSKSAALKEYDRLIARMREEVLDVAGTMARGGKRWRTLAKVKHAISNSKPSWVGGGTNQKLSPLERDLMDKPEEHNDSGTSQSGNHQRQNAAQVTDSNQKVPSDNDLRSAGSSEQKPSDNAHDEGRNPMATTAATNSTFSPVTTSSGKPVLLKRSEKMAHELRPSTSEREDQELLAEAIISSVVEAVPSPTNLRPSLMERTRMSMALPSSPKIHRSTAMGPPPPPTPPTEQPPKLGLQTGLMDIDRRSTLVERTRQSMSMLPPTSHKPRQSQYRLHAAKDHPVNQFETPKKRQQQQHTSTDEAKDSTPPEELFSQQADYASVFKSRPKIALSPPVSLSLNPECPSGFDAFTDRASNGGSPWASSPPMKAR